MHALSVVSLSVQLKKSVIGGEVGTVLFEGRRVVLLAGELVETESVEVGEVGEVVEVVEVVDDEEDNES